MNQDLSQCVEVVKDGKIVPELRSVLELIRDHNAVLGTAHIAPEEISQLWKLHGIWSKKHRL